MTISVVVPVYNAGARLAIVIEALLSQDYPRDEYQVILVDNASTDNSAAIIARYPQVLLLTETKPGAYAARNRGIREATGRILAFTDSDCAVDRGWLRAIQCGLSGGVKVLLGRSRPAVESGLIALLCDYENEKAHYVCQTGQPRQQYAYTNNMAILRETWTEHGPFAEVMRGGDVILVRGIVDCEPRGAVAYCPAMVVRHLELTGVASYCRKMYIYGRSLQNYRRIVAADPLSLNDRVQVFRRTANEHQYGPGKECALLAALSSGFAAWAAGGLRDRRHPTKPHSSI